MTRLVSMPTASVDSAIVAPAESPATKGQVLAAHAIKAKNNAETFDDAYAELRRMSGLPTPTDAEKAADQAGRIAAKLQQCSELLAIQAGLIHTIADMGPGVTVPGPEPFNTSDVLTFLRARDTDAKIRARVRDGLKPYDTATGR